MSELVNYGLQAQSAIPAGTFQLKSWTDWPNWYI